MSVSDTLGQADLTGPGEATGMAGSLEDVIVGLQKSIGDLCDTLQALPDLAALDDSVRHVVIIGAITNVLLQKSRQFYPDRSFLDVADDLSGTVVAIARHSRRAGDVTAAVDDDGRDMPAPEHAPALTAFSDEPRAQEEQ